jgi:hypothetical protein
MDVARLRRAGKNIIKFLSTHFKNFNIFRMKKDKLLIVLFVLVIVLLLIIFIFYGSKIVSFFNSQNVNTKEKVTRGDPSMILVQLKDAETELTTLQELAFNQEQSAKIDVLLSKIADYQTEFKKTAKEITQQEIEDFYNSNLWQNIADLKNEIGSNGHDKETAPELE